MGEKDTVNRARVPFIEHSECGPVSTHGLVDESRFGGFFLHGARGGHGCFYYKLRLFRE